MDIKKALLLCLLLIPSLVFAHGGRTDKYGCHHDRKHGGYHCHNSGSPSPSPAVNSVNSSAGNANAQPLSSPVSDRNFAANKELVLKIQAELNRLQYPVGVPDGVLREKTVKAIKYFQVDNELMVDGKPTYLLLDFLVKKTK
jgi:hypothetical protein